MSRSDYPGVSSEETTCKLTAATALALVGVLGGASTAGAAEAHSPARTDCRGIICMWSGYNYGGAFEVFDPLTSVYVASVR